MQFNNIIATSFMLLLSAVLALPSPGSSPAEGHELDARACSYTSGCRSKIGVTAGRYCGYCSAVTGEGTSFTSVFQLNGKAGASGCCKYGVSSLCATYWETGSAKGCPLS